MGTLRGEGVEEAIEIIQRLHGYTKRGGVGGSNRNHTKEDGETIEIIHMTHWYNKEDGEQ